MVVLEIQIIRHLIYCKQSGMAVYSKKSVYIEGENGYLLATK